MKRTLDSMDDMVGRTVEKVYSANMFKYFGIHFTDGSAMIMESSDFFPQSEMEVVQPEKVQPWVLEELNIL